MMFFLGEVPEWLMVNDFGFAKTEIYIYIYILLGLVSVGERDDILFAVASPT